MEQPPKEPKKVGLDIGLALQFELAGEIAIEKLL